MSEPDKPEMEVAQLLAELRVDPPDDGFEAALTRRLASADALADRAEQAARGADGRSDAARAGLWRRPWFIGAVWGTATGIAAGVAAFLLMAQLHDREGTATAGMATPIEGPARLEGPVAAAGRADARAPVQSSAFAPANPAADPAADPTADPTANEGTACPPTEVASRAEVVVLPAGKVALVRLHFDVPTDVEGAEFSVLLPRGLSFFSDGHALPERSFHWVSSLRAGDNEVPVAVVAEDPGQHRLTATATIDGEVVVHEVILDVQEPV